MNMSCTYLDFMADAIGSGSLLGIEIGSTLNEVERCLPGVAYIDDVDRKKTSLRRDYGLCELSFGRGLEGGWECNGAMIQVHRLAYGIDVPSVIAEKYGKFPLYVTFVALQTALRNRGIGLDEVEMRAGSGYKYFSNSSSRSKLIVAGEGWAPGIPDDSVWSVQVFP